MKKIFTLLCGIVFAAQSTFSLAQTTTMQIWKDGKVTYNLESTEVDSVTFATEEESSDDGIYTIDGHEFVDLGLPSGILWATCNVGAEKPADTGYYFAWAETEPKATYTWDSYAYGWQNSLTKYQSTEGSRTLEAEDDAATVNWGSSCRMPSQDDFAEILDEANCSWEWTTQENSSDETMNGALVTSKTNGRSIFLPATGYYDGTTLERFGTMAYYWSRTMSYNYAAAIHCLYFSDSHFYVDTHYRQYGEVVRPVAEAK